MSTVKRDFIKLLGKKDRKDSSVQSGTVADIGTGSVTLTYFGVDIDGIRYVDTYTPTIGDNVVVSRSSGTLLILGKV